MKKIYLILGISIFFSGAVLAQGQLDLRQYAHSGIAPSNAVRVPLITVYATAHNDDVAISEIIVRRRGLSQPSDFGRLIAITDSYRRSLHGNVLSDDLARLRFQNALVVPEGTTEKITIYGNLNFDPASGRTMFFTLEEVVSDAQEKDMLTQPREFTPVQNRYRAPYARFTEKQGESGQLNTQPEPTEKIHWGIRCENQRCVRIRRD
ncbi:hypothetical protein K9M59_02650 [Candidatus Gracilibacteria bacterium]|nr:hypothetical protein [Candidatus Gracilibacteria bacterium]